MSIALMTLAFKVALPTTQKFVLVALCDSANDQGECYPSVTSLMSKCSMSDRGIQKSIVELEAGGYLRREFRNGRSTVYWMTPEHGSPRTMFPPNDVHPTPERRSPPPPNTVHPTPEPCSPITVIEPSVEPKKKREKVVTGSRIGPAWNPSEADVAYAADKGVDARSEAESFRDHWLADTTPKALKADWAAAWRTWVRNSVKYGRARNHGSVETFQQRAARERMQQLAPGVAAKAPGAAQPTEFFDAPAKLIA